MPSLAAETSDGVLFVVDQDLRAPEVAAIKRLMATGKPLYLVLNKSDQFNASDRDAILVSIRAKLPAGFSASQRRFGGGVAKRRSSVKSRMRGAGCGPNCGDLRLICAL